MASSIRWLHNPHPPLYNFLTVSPKPQNRNPNIRIRAFDRGDFDGFARRVASGEVLKDAWRSANDSVELIAFEAQRAAERIDRRFLVTSRLDSFARATTVRAREIDQELGIAQRWRSFSVDFSRNWPRFHMQKFVPMIVAIKKSEGLFASQGGPVMLSHIENEYEMVESAFHEKGPPYVTCAASIAESLQTGVPWMMCKQQDAPDPVIMCIWLLIPIC